MTAELNYAEYLHLDSLLDLQHPRSEPAEHDETLFIVFHQITELWFKQLLHELDGLVVAFRGGRTFAATSILTRVLRIMKAVVSQLDILETMTPLSFNAFRERLDRASGLQSMQFRELECLLGHKNAARLDSYPEPMPGLDRARARLAAPSVVDAFYDFLEQHEVAIPASLRERDITLPTVPDPEVQDGLLDRYLADRELRIVFELMTDVDEALQEWRYRHVKLVERTIGNKPGSGGTSGLDYLKSTLFQPVFPDLWAIRHRL